MNIQIIEGVEGAKQAKGTAVIIDVLRAATVTSYLLNQGVTSITPVSTQEEAFKYKNESPDVLLVGEDQGIKIDGFDLGNSPAEIKKLDLIGKTAIHRSTTGTQGLVNAINAREIIFGSFVSAQPILTYLRSKNPQEITFVPMYALEDQLFAEYMQNQLLGRIGITLSDIKSKLMQQEWLLGSFLNPENTLFPEEDFHLALELDVFDFFPLIVDGKIVKSI
jgi:2-phosphosulfolactate phosphatase